MPSMRVDLAGLFASIAADLRAGRRSMAALRAFELQELLGHLEATLRGEHTLAEFAEHYCLDRQTKEAG